MSELDKLYSPSEWSKRPNVLNTHMSFIEKESAKIRFEIECQLNVSYGNSNRQKMDIFGTDLPDESPVVVFVHGGYWQTAQITRASYHFLASNFHKHKIKTIFVGYDLCPDVSLKDIVHQFQIGIKKCFNYAINNKSKGVYIVGHSAGAHLIATLFTDLTTLPNLYKMLFKAAVLVSGIYDLRSVQKTTVNELVKMDEATAEQLSPMRLKLNKSTTGSCFVVVGEVESPEFVKQSEEFAHKLEQFGVQTQLIVVPKVDHFDIIELLATTDYQLSKFIVDIIGNDCFNVHNA